MKNCYPQNATIVVSYTSIYLALKIIHEEHQKSSGQAAKYDAETIRKGLSKFIVEPIYIEEILGELIFNGLIQENSAVEHFPLTYSLTLKGANLYGQYIETIEYMQVIDKSQNELGRKVHVDDLFSLDLKQYTTPIAYNFFVSFIEKE
jgi:hypothetical protein